ncbi:MAG: hypothetical protein WC606_05110 [Candidatus Absconditabacterales bacterium]|jgi:hypothetical protein
MTNKNNKVFVYQRQIKIMLRIPVGHIDLFLSLKEAFIKEGFFLNHPNEGSKPNKISSEIPVEYIDRTNGNYFFVIIMEYDEERFYQFIKKLSLKKGLLFEAPNEDKSYIARQDNLKNS